MWWRFEVAFTVAFSAFSVAFWVEFWWGSLVRNFIWRFRVMASCGRGGMSCAVAAAGCTGGGGLSAAYRTFLEPTERGKHGARKRAEVYVACRDLLLERVGVSPLFLWAARARAGAFTLPSQMHVMSASAALSPTIGDLTR